MGQRTGFSPNDLAKINAMYCSQKVSRPNGPANNRPVKRPPNVNGSPFYPTHGYYPDYYPDYPNYGAPYPPSYPNYPNYGPPNHYRPPFNPGPGFFPPRPFPKKENVEA